MGCLTAPTKHTGSSKQEYYRLILISGKLICIFVLKAILEESVSRGDVPDN